MIRTLKKRIDRWVDSWLPGDLVEFAVFVFAIAFILLACVLFIAKLIVAVLT